MISAIEARDISNKFYKDKIPNIPFTLGFYRYELQDIKIQLLLPSIILSNQIYRKFIKDATN